MIRNRISKTVGAAMLLTSFSVLSYAATSENFRLDGDTSHFNEAKHTQVFSGNATATMSLLQGSTLRINAKEISVMYSAPRSESKSAPEKVMQLEASSDVRVDLDGKLIAEGNKANYDAKRNTLRVTGDSILWHGTKMPEGIVIDTINGAVKSVPASKSHS